MSERNKKRNLLPTGPVVLVLDPDTGTMVPDPVAKRRLERIALEQGKVLPGVVSEGNPKNGRIG